MSDYHGCSDGGCIFGHPGGMHTNGGCACVREMRSANRDQDEISRILQGIRTQRDTITALRAEVQALREFALRMYSEDEWHCAEDAEATLERMWEAGLVDELGNPTPLLTGEPGPGGEENG